MQVRYISGKANILNTHRIIYNNFKIRLPWRQWESLSQEVSRAKLLRKSDIFHY